MMKRAKLLLLIMFSIVTLSALAQTIAVSGTVKDNHGHPIEGVDIIVKNTAKSAHTNIDGKYKIDAKIGDTLVFRAIGMISQEHKVEGSKLDLVLQEDSPALPMLEELVIAYSVNEHKRQTNSRPSLREMPATLPVASSHSYDMAGTETYSEFSGNKFNSPLKAPYSTFSIDVDTESYSNMRRMINQGSKPDHDAIRVEELINYFKYDYSIPKGDDPINISTEIADCPWESKHRLVKIGLKAKDIPLDKLPKSNLVFLIDVSGSMAGPNRIDLVKSSMKLLLNQLRDDDQVAVVVYASEIGEKLKSTAAKDKKKIAAVIDGLVARGGTSGGKAIQEAYRIARENFIKDGNNRIILCTDGDFNIGVTDDKELERMIEKERESGVYLSILAYGMGNYQSQKMQTLSQAGNGNHAYIDNAQEANRVLVKEFGSSMYTLANDVKLQIEFNPAKVQAYRLIGYETRLLEDEDFNDDTVDAGEIGVGHTVTALYEVIPVGVKSDVMNIDELRYQDKKEIKSKSDDLLTVKLRYKEPGTDKSKKIEKVLLDDGRNNPSADFKFASSVALFGQLLRGSSFVNKLNYDDVIKIAKSGYGEDEDGYRREFVRLVEATKGLNTN